MKNTLRILLPVVILLAGFGIKELLIASGPIPEQQEITTYAPLVEVALMKAETTRVQLPAYGEVRPRATTTLVAEVGARVVTVSPNLYRGAFFEKDDVLVELDGSDFRNAVAMATAEVDKAQAALLLEEAEAELAISEWQDLGDGPVPSLVAREPQLAAANAALSAAVANLDIANTNLARTIIRAPFAGRSLQRDVEVGALAAPGLILASIYATDAAEVTLPIAANQLGHLGLAVSGTSTPLDVRFTTEVGESDSVWHGKIIRTEASVDPGTRMVTAIAQIDRPFRPSAEGTPALAPGMFLRATIDGRELKDVYRVPRAALLDGDFVRFVDQGMKARQVKVEVQYATITDCYVTAGIDEGMRLIVSTLPLFVDGMDVKILDTIQGEER